VAFNKVQGNHKIICIVIYLHCDLCIVFASAARKENSFRIIWAALVLPTLNVTSQSRPQSPRSFWPAAGIESSGLVQHRKSAIHGLPVKSGKSDSLRIRNECSLHAQKIGSAQISRSLPQARRIVGSGDENGNVAISEGSYVAVRISIQHKGTHHENFVLSHRMSNVLVRTHELRYQLQPYRVITGN